MKAIPLMILVTLGSCGSNSKKSESTDPAAGVKLSNQDFKKSKPVAYTPTQDRYSVQGGSALGSETLSQLDSKTMGQVATDKEPMSVMMAQCYRGDFESALKIADSIFNSFQKHPSYWNQLGSCHLLKGNERKALLFYNKSLEVKANYAPALNNIGVIYKRNGQDQKAHVAFDKASKSSRFSKTPRYNLAYLYLHNGIAEKAFTLFSSLLSENPSEIEVLIGAANSSALTGRWAQALELFMRVPDQYRSRSDVGLNMSLAAYQMNKRDVARQILSNTKVSDVDRGYFAQLSQVIGE